MPRRMPSSRGLIPADFTKFTAQTGQPWTTSEEDFLLASLDWCLEHGIHFHDIRFEILQTHSTRELSEGLVRNKLKALVLSLRSSQGNLTAFMAEGSTILDLSEKRKRNMQGWFGFIDARYYYLKPLKPAPVSPVAPIAPVAQPCHSSSEAVQDGAQLIQHHLQLAHEDSALDNATATESQVAPEPSVDNVVAQDSIVVQDAIPHGAHDKNPPKSSGLVSIPEKQPVSFQTANSRPSSPVLSKKDHMSQQLTSVPSPRSIRAETPVPLPPIPGKRNSPTQLQYPSPPSHSEAYHSPKRRCKALSGQVTAKAVSPASSTKRKSSDVTANPVSTLTLQGLTNTINSGHDFPAPKPRPALPVPLNKTSSTVSQPLVATSSAACTKSPRKASRSEEEPVIPLPNAPSPKQNNGVVSNTEAPNPFGLRYFGLPESVKEPNWKDMFHQERKLRMELNHLFHNKFPRNRTETVREFDVLNSRIKNLSLLICALKTGITPQSLLRCPKDHGELMHKCIQRVAGYSPVAQARLSLDKDVQSYELLSALIMAAIFETVIQLPISVLFTPPDELALCYREIYLEECGVTGLDKMDFLCFWRYIQKPKFRNTIIPKKVYELRQVFIKALGGLLPGIYGAKTVEGDLEELEVIEELDGVLTLALDIKLALSLYMESFHFHFFEHGDKFDPVYMKASGRPLDKSAAASVKLCLSPIMFKATQNETEGTEYDILSPGSVLPFNRAIRVTMHGDDFSKYAKALEAVVVL